MPQGMFVNLKNSKVHMTCEHCGRTLEDGERFDVDNFGLVVCKDCYFETEEERYLKEIESEEY